MKILLAGSARHMAVEWHFIRPLEAMGVEVHQFPAHDMIHEFHSRGLINKVLLKTGWFMYPKVNKKIIQLAAEIKPDVIWIFKGMEFYPSTIEELSKQFIVVNYNPDHPFEFFSRGSGNKNVSGSIRYFHTYLTYSEKIAAELEQRFNVRTGILPFGYEYGTGVLEKAKAAKEINRCCFIGNPDNNRVTHINALLKAGIPVDVFGHGWDKLFPADSSPSLTVTDAVYGDDFWVKARQYRVQLNVFRPHNENSHNMRSFELPGIGAIQLAPYSEEHAKFFEEGKEIFLFRDTGEMIQKAQALLSLTEAEALAIREKSYERSIHSGYSYTHRARQVYDLFKKISSAS